MSNIEEMSIRRLISMASPDHLTYSIYLLYGFASLGIDIPEAVNLVLEDLYGTE
jgi:hypothetical protein